MNTTDNYGRTGTHGGRDRDAGGQQALPQPLQTMRQVRGGRERPYLREERDRQVATR